VERRTYQSFEEVLPAAGEVDGTAEDVRVAFVLELLEHCVNDDVDAGTTATVTAYRYVVVTTTIRLRFDGRSTKDFKVVVQWYFSFKYHFSFSYSFGGIFVLILQVGRSYYLCGHVYH